MIAVDANPDFGTLARLAPEDRRAERSLADLLADAEKLKTAAELNAYVSRLPSGLHLLGAPREAELTASLGPDRYGELVAFLSCFYEVVLLDLGTGVAGPLARFAIERADQAVLVTTPEWVTSSVVLEALWYLKHERTTVAINKSLLRSGDLRAIEERFRAEHLHHAVTIPHDEQLATMLDTGSYGLDTLAAPDAVGDQATRAGRRRTAAVMRALREHPPVTVVKALRAARLVAREVQSAHARRRTRSAPS